MEIKINKEIKDYNETLFFGLSKPITTLSIIFWSISRNERTRSWSSIPV